MNREHTIFQQRMTTHNYIMNSIERTKSKVPYVVEEINTRKKNNMDTRIMVTGEGGSGKSFLALKIGELIQPETFIEKPQWAVNHQVHFSAAEYMKSVTELPDGSVIIYDEPGQSFNAREFMSEANLILTKTLIGYRFMHFVNLFCVPTIALIDKSARMLCQYKIDVLKHGYAELQRVHPSRYNADIWYPPLGDLHVDMPNLKLRNCYKKKKEKVQKELYAHYYSKLDKMDKKDMTLNDMIDIVMQAPAEFFDNSTDKVDITEIQTRFSIGDQKARAVAKQVVKRIANKPEK